MNVVIVNIEKGVKGCGCIEKATRRAWPLCAIKAKNISAVVGLVKGNVKSVIIDCYAAQDHLLPKRFKFTGGDVFTTELHNIKHHPLLFKQLGGTRGHRYARSVHDLIEIASKNEK